MIIDACIYNGETDLLELRMHELNPVVDKFLVVQSDETFSGNKKEIEPFWKSARFEPFESKLILVDTVLYPDYTDAASGWQREKYQRDTIHRQAKAFNSPSDILICSDADEIPSAVSVFETVPKLKDGMHRMELDLYYYNVNTFVSKWPWGTTIGTLAQYENVGGSHSARGVNFTDANIVKNAGWHFSYFGGVDRIRTKVESFSHSQDDFCQAFLKRDNAEAAKDIAARSDIYRTRGLDFFKHRPNNQDLPKYLLSNPEKYSHFMEG